MAEFYEALELEVISNRESWRKLAEGIAKNRTKKKENYLLVNKKTLRLRTKMNIREVEKEIAQLRAAGLNKGSSVNTKSISGETDDDAASLTSEPIHKRLDHCDK